MCQGWQRRFAIIALTLTFVVTCSCTTPNSTLTETQQNITLDIPPASDSSHYAAVCTVVRDQHDDLREWIEYHLYIGFGKIYLYDHNSSTPLITVVQDLIHTGAVEYIYFSEYPQTPDLTLFQTTAQGFAYNDCITRARHRHHWLAFVDADEFLVLHNTTKPNINLLLKDYENYGGLGVNWIIFGTSAWQQRPLQGALAGYTKCLPPQTPVHSHIKTIGNTQHLLGFKHDPHTGEYTTGMYAVNENFERIEQGYRTQTPSHRRISTHHYFLKSTDQFARKMRRGSGDGRRKKWGMFNVIEKLSTDTCAWAVPLAFDCCPSVRPFLTPVESAVTPEEQPDASLESDPATGGSPAASGTEGTPATNTTVSTAAINPAASVNPAASGAVTTPAAVPAAIPVTTAAPAQQADPGSATAAHDPVPPAAAAAPAAVDVTSATSPTDAAMANTAAAAGVGSTDSGTAAAINAPAAAKPGTPGVGAAVPTDPAALAASAAAALQSSTAAAALPAAANVQGTVTGAAASNAAAAKPAAAVPAAAGAAASDTAGAAPAVAAELAAAVTGSATGPAPSAAAATSPSTADKPSAASPGAAAVDAAAQGNIAQAARQDAPAANVAGVPGVGAENSAVAVLPADPAAPHAADVAL